MADNVKSVSITVLLPAGRLPLDLMAAAQELAVTHNFGIYLSTTQNLRLIDVPEEVAESVKEKLEQLGADFKAPGKFPLPRVCIGEGHCKLGVSDPERLSRKILAAYSSRSSTKAKLKIAISACTMCCSGAKTTDIGIVATRDGYELYTGGKGGPFPKIGRRIARNIDEERVIALIGELVDYHDSKTSKKQRMAKLVAEDEFPFSAV